MSEQLVPAPGSATDEEWTPLQEAYLQKLMATYQANLYFFKERFPQIFEKIMATDIALPFTVGPKAELEIFTGKFKGDRRDFTDLGKLLLKIFEDSNSRPRISVANDYVDNPLAIAPHRDDPNFYEHTEPRFRIELVSKFMEMTKEEGSRVPLPDFGDHKLPIAFVFGSGYGWHLDRLVDDWEMRHLILVDTDIERLNLSLYFVDYIALEQRFSRKGYYFSVAYDADPLKLSDHLRQLLYHFWPPYFAQGAGLFFNDYDSEKVHELWGKLKKDLWTLYRGWGFLDDEMLGLKHAVENGVDRLPLFKETPRKMPEHAVAIVVGAGPSLDTLMPILREYGDRAVIFSCGSSITALAREGIKPDFHVEVERTHITCRFLEEPVTRAMVQDVPIIALSIMHPAVFGLTNRPLMFLKELDLGCAISDFYGERPRFRSGPTCTNGGLGLALKMGFREIYLAGVDLGFKDEKKHHSKSSIYFDEKAEIDEELQRYVVTTHNSHKESDHVVPGNFGGEVFSTETLLHTRDSMVLTLREYPQCIVYNLNDGVRIEGAEARKPEDFRCHIKPDGKKEALENAYASFTTDYDPDPLARLRFLEVQLQAVIEDVKRILSPEINSKMEACDLLYDLHQYFYDERHSSTQIFPLVRGSMLHMGRFLYDCVVLMKDEQKAAEFARFGFDLFARFLSAGLATMDKIHDVGLARIQMNHARSQQQQEADQGAS